MCLGHIMFKFSFKKNPVEFNPNSGMTKKLMGDKFPLLAERTRKYRALLQELPREELELTTADGLKLKGWFFDAGSKNTAIFVHGKADTFIPCTAAEEMYALCPTEKELLLVDGFGHAGSQLAEDAYYEPIFAFIEKYLK